jgi:transcriptional regulator with XRE-family HTH domain
VRRRPRRFPEWKALRSWGRLPAWELEPVGYLLRAAREAAGLTQAELARRLGCTQQAVAQAERWESNPTVGFIRRWAEACGSKLKLVLD